MTTNAMSDYLEAKLINYIFRGQAFTQPANLYIALCSGVPVDVHTGASHVAGHNPGGIPELMPHGSGGTAGGYYRMVIPSGTDKWDAPTSAGGDTENTSALTFPTATSNWGQVSVIAMCDD